MVGYAKIIEIGEELRKLKQDNISRNELYKFLREKTNSHHDKTIVHYAKMLVDAKFISQPDENYFKILRERK